MAANGLIKNGVRRVAATPVVTGNKDVASRFLPDGKILEPRLNPLPLEAKAAQQFAAGAAPSVIDKTVGVASTTANVAGFSGLIASAFSGILGAGVWISSNAGLKTLENWATRAQSGVQTFLAKPFSEVFGRNRVGEVVAKGAQSTANVTGKSVAFVSKPAGATIKELPSIIGKSAVLEGVAHTAFLGMSAVNMVNSTTALNRELKAASAVETATGDHNLAARERHIAMGSYALSTAAEVASAGLLVKQMAGKMPGGLLKGMLLFALPQLVEAGVRAFLPKSQTPAIAQLTQAHASGRPIDPAIYAEFLVSTCPEFQIRGTENPFTQAIAKQYAAERLGVKEILAENKSGALLARVQAVIAANEAAKVAAPVAATAPAATGHSHVASLSNKKTVARSKPTQPVLGGHTANVVASSLEAPIVERS